MTLRIALQRASKRYKGQSLLPKRRRVDRALSCRSSRIALAFLAMNSARVQIANHASARTISTLALLGCCKNPARPALRATSKTSSAVDVVPRDRKYISSRLADRANSKSSLGEYWLLRVMAALQVSRLCSLG